MNIFALTCRELVDELRLRYGKGLYHAAALYREIFRRGNRSFAHIPEFLNSPSLAELIARAIHFPSCRIVSRQQEGGVVKFAATLPDGLIIESVIIPANGRTTLCVSCQVGCGRGCTFCATGQIGLKRNLTVEEIVWQVCAARFELNHHIDNIVFMGMGEPFDNFDPVMQAIRVIADQRGLNIACSHITLSTAGHADGIRKLAAQNLSAVRLAVSLNAPEDKLRSEIMPINREYPLSRLKDELNRFPVGKNGTILIEYVLLAGINDSVDNAERLACYLEGLPVRVNIIPFNSAGLIPYQAPNNDQVGRFCRALVEKHIFIRLRKSRGRRIMAACGQLGASLSARKPIKADSSPPSPTHPALIPHTKDSMTWRK